MSNSITSKSLLKHKTYQECRICNNPRLNDINRAIIKNIPYKKIIKDYSTDDFPFDAGHLEYHYEKCLVPTFQTEIVKADMTNKLLVKDTLLEQYNLFGEIDKAKELLDTIMKDRILDDDRLFKLYLDYIKTRAMLVKQNKLITDGKLKDYNPQVNAISKLVENSKIAN